MIIITLLGVFCISIAISIWRSMGIDYGAMGEKNYTILFGDLLLPPIFMTFGYFCLTLGG